ncbi:tetratricopeptide repeat protein [Streptomyces sp. HNM0574]|uniref:tetratricopeptide repeat protein n=1 Tax=Streptomyces sp. HNM0574 TaxID=2714954 RepID=UPI00146AEE85|nr:tetratricopeptide repeat protein [Streptomyces sp. HNM0574]NLU68841.1 tetratricopeptide repeat protein [Streptomyces sp. HNM0574]
MSGEGGTGAHIEASGERAVAAQWINHVYTGDVLPAEALHAPERVAAAPGTSNLPPAALCLGREEELAELRRVLNDRSEGAITQSGAVRGLGGIGKSALALHYAHRYRGEYGLVWWLNAASPDEIETSLTGLTRTLVPGWAASAERGAQVEWARQWLAWHPDWLLVYDNVEDPEDLAPYTGALHQGHHLATSRRTTGWPDSAATLTLGSLHPEDAVDLLCRLVFKDAEPTARERVEARALVADLGHLPLAVKQAGAYLARNRGISLARYRRRLEPKLGKAVDGTDPERSVARVWNITLRTLEEVEPPAVELLYLLAWLAPDAVPHTLVTPPGVDPDEVAEVIGTLAAYSMVTDTGTHVGMHRLVQTVLRAPRDTGSPGASRRLEGREYAERAVLHGLTPPPGGDAPTEAQWDALTPHLIALASGEAGLERRDGTPASGEEREDRGDTLTGVYEFAASRLDDQGHGARAVPLLEAALARCEQRLGDSHPDTVTTRSNLAATYLAAGNLARAVPMLETALAQSEQLLGDTHEGTLHVRYNLAGACTLAGDLERAVPLLEATLAQYEQVLGDSHPRTLATRGNVADLYRRVGDPERAVSLFEATLARCEEVLGDTHPDTLNTRKNLGYACQEAGDPERAVRLFTTVLTQRAEVLGDLHPDTLTSRQHLAHAYASAGDLERALALFEVTLAQYEQVLGESHPYTLINRNNLAGACWAAGDRERAVRLFEITVAQSEQALGEDHPDTVATRRNLVHARGGCPDRDVQGPRQAHRG